MKVLRVNGGPLDGRVVPEAETSGTRPVILLDVERLQRQAGLEDVVVGELRWDRACMWYERSPF